MAIKTLFAATPSVINATYDKVWIEEIVISAPDPGGDASARVKLRKFRSTEDGAEFSPDPWQWISVEGIVEKGQSDPDLELAIDSLMAYISRIAIEQGVVADSE